jgi:hypothetical protein
MSLVWSRRFISSAEIEAGFPPFKPKPHTTELGPLPKPPKHPDFSDTTAPPLVFVSNTPQQTNQPLTTPNTT